MEELELSFIGKGEVKGFMFTQIKRNDCAYLYEVKNDSNVWYEIFERRINTQYNCLSYPRSNAFGSWAFSNPFKDRANEIFEELTIRVNNRLESNGK